MIRTERGWRDIRDLLHLALGLGGWKPKNASEKGSPALTGTGGREATVVGTW